MDLKKLLKLINSKEARRSEVYEKAQTTESVEELRSLSSELETLDEEIKELRSLYDTLSGGVTDESWQNNNQATPEGRSSQEQQFNPIASFSQGGNQLQNRGEEDVYGTLEYRQAFRNYVISGTPIPDKFKTEERADLLTTVGDVGAVIPTTILNKVIEDITVEGKILSRVTQTGYQGGVAIPILELTPEATWLSDESVPSDEQKSKMEATVTFAYHTLEAKVAIGLLASTVSLPIFEQTVVKQLKKAMIRAIETAIVKGSGAGQPLGFLNMEIPADQIKEISSDTIGTVTTWAEVEGMIPEAVEDEVIYVLSKPTWEKYLNGMVDKNGQKIGLGKINEKGKKILNGREVLTVDKLPSFDAAQTGDIFGAVINLTQYMLNSNLNMYYKKYFNEDKNKWIHKALMIADGKMAMGKDSKQKMVGAEGLIYLKKGEVTPTKLTRAQQLAIEKAKKEMEEVVKGNEA